MKIESLGITKEQHIKNLQSEGLRIIDEHESFVINAYTQLKIRKYINCKYFNMFGVCSMDIFNAFIQDRYDLEEILDEISNI